MDQAKLDQYLLRGKALFDDGTIDRQEGYKLKLIEDLARARDAVLAGEKGWDSLVGNGLSMRGPAMKGHKGGNPTRWPQHKVISEWIRIQPDDALQALQMLWANDDTPPGERIRLFVERVPEHKYFHGKGVGDGTRLSLVAHLLMGLGQEYPPFAIRKFEKVWDYLEYPRPSANADEGGIYEYALDFLDKIKERSHALGHERPRDFLDAQSLVWTMNGILENGIKPPPDPLAERIDALAKKLLLPPKFLREIADLLKDKKQIIFQGPPGTGKTYVARELAKCLAESDDRVRIVQFHPSYAYEDFVEGFRPVRDKETKQAGFELREGPLRQMADQAWDRDRDELHFLVIDEINRGNLSKILGELYYLLEYRADDEEDDDDDLEMQLQYSDESFAMPSNLYLIGTMNTADRSIALVDAALRRRFYFVEFHPDEEPIKGLLRAWLDKYASAMDWVADVVDLANRKLSNREAAIGPSYFMKKDGLDEEKMKRVWKYNGLPYIEEQLYGSTLSLDEFKLDNLRKELAQGNDTAEAQGETTNGGGDTG